MFNLSRWALLFADWQIFAQGFLITIAVSTVSLIFTLLISFAVGIIRCTQSGKIKGVCTAYINFFSEHAAPCSAFVHVQRASANRNCFKPVCLRLPWAFAVHGSVWGKRYRGFD